MLENTELLRFLDTLESTLDVSAADLIILADHCGDALSRGLRERDYPPPMLTTHIPYRLTSHEHGVYLSVDFGGTNLRVCRVVLSGDEKPGTFHMDQHTVVFSEKVMKGTGKELWNFVAEEILNFTGGETHIDVDASQRKSSVESMATSPVRIREMRSMQQRDNGVNLGFTFSFPVRQRALDSGVLLQWTKGFNASGVVGKDVIQLLRDALDHKQPGHGVRVVGLVNDTTGTLLTAGYRDPRAQVGVIFGTGTNAAYYELASAISDLEYKQGEMIVNTEWGGMDPRDDQGNLLLPVTEYDRRLDRESLNPRKQRFEKMISGYYLGELCRLILVHMSDLGLVFGEQEGIPGDSMMNQKNGLDTAHVSRVLKDTSEHLNDVEVWLQSVMECPGSHLQDRQAVKRVCEMVSRRAARLGAAALSAVLLKRRDILDQEQGVVVGVDGSVWAYLPGFKPWLKQGLSDVLGEPIAKKVEFLGVRDGSGVGAALAAALIASPSSH